MKERELFERRAPWRPRGRYYWIYRPKPGEQVEGVLLNHFLEEHLTHWIRGRSVPHIPEWQGCEGCQNGWEPYRRWYSGIALIPTGKIGLIELTEGALESCPCLGEENYECRGQRIKVRRAPGKPNGRLSVELIGPSPYIERCPPPVSISQAMMQILEVFRGKQGSG